MSLRWVGVAAGTVAALALSGCTALGSLDRSGGEPTVEPIVLEMASGYSTSEITPYADQVQALSDGGIRIAVLSHEETVSRYPDAGAQSGTGVLEAVRSGDVPLGIVSVRDLSDLGVDEADVLQAPLVIDSYELEAELLGDDDVVQPILDAVERLGVAAVGILPGPLVHPFGIARDVVDPGDLAGLSVGVSPGGVGEATLRELGATPIGFDGWGESVDGLDAIAMQLAAVTGNGYHTAGGSVTTDIALWPRALVVIADPDVLDGLEGDQPEVLAQAATASIPDVVAVHSAMEDEAASIACEAGLRLVQAGDTRLEEWHRAVAPIVAEIAQTDAGAAAIDRAAALGASTPTSAPVCIAKPAQWPTETAPTLDGTYSFDNDPDDLRAVGVAERDLVAENWGHWVLVVDAGRFAWSQENADACTWAYGQWRMDDRYVRLTFEDGGGIAPNYAFNRPGEDFLYSWTEYAGTLQWLQAMDREDGPPDFVWTRMSTTPDPGEFPDRCPLPPEAFPGG